MAALAQRREALIEVARQRVEAVLQLLDRVLVFLELPVEGAHLLFELTDAHFGRERRSVGLGHRRRPAARIRAAIDLALQQIDVALESVDAVEQRLDVLLRESRRGKRRRQPEQDQARRLAPPLARKGVHRPILIATRPGDSRSAPEAFQANERFRQKKGACPRSAKAIAKRGAGAPVFQDRGVAQLMTVMPTRFCAHACSFEPTTTGRSLP